MCHTQAGPARVSSSPATGPNPQDLVHGLGDLTRGSEFQPLLESLSDAGPGARVALWPPRLRHA